MKKLLGPLRGKSKGSPSTGDKEKRKKEKGKNFTGGSGEIGSKEDYDESVIVVHGSTAGNTAGGESGHHHHRRRDSEDVKGCMRPILRSALLANKKKKNDGGSGGIFRDLVVNDEQSLTVVGRCESWSAGTTPHAAFHSLQSGKVCQDKNKLCASAEGLIDDDHPLLDRAQSDSAVFFQTSSTETSGGGVGSKTLCSNSPRTPIFANDVNRHLYTTLVGVLASKSPKKDRDHDVSNYNHDQLPPTSPTAVTSGTTSDMGNRPSGQSEEEAPLGAIRPSRSCSGDVGLSDHANASHHAAHHPQLGEDAEDEVEVPPPMKPISQQLLEATANAKTTEESQAKRSVSMPLKGNEGSTTAELATELEQIVRERMEQHENVERLNELSLNDSTSTPRGLSSPDFPGPSSSSENYMKTGNGSVTSGEMGTIGGETGGSSTADTAAGGSLESPVTENETALAIKKRTYVIRELVETEQDYVRDLKETVDGYLAIMRDANSEIPMPEDLRGGRDKIVFGNLQAIYEWHRDIFCKGLERCIEHPEELGHLFKKYERRLHMYVVYCQNKPMSEYIVSEHIDTYFEDIRQKLGHKLTLCDLLIKPVQRIMKYQLLLKDILKYTERIGNKDEIEILKKACHVMHVVPKEANDMMNVGRLQGFDGKITAQGKLLLSGSLFCSEGTTAVNFKGKELQVFFFEHCIIFSESVGKKTQFSNPAYIYKAHIQVNKMCVTETVDDGDPCKFVLRSTDPKKPNLSFVCQTSSKESREEWTGQLQQILQTQKDFLKAIQSPIKYQKNKLTKEVSSPELLWTSPEHSKTVIAASTATVSVVPTPFVGCTSPLALDHSSLSKLQQGALMSSHNPAALPPPHTPLLSRVSFAQDGLNSSHGCTEAGQDFVDGCVAAFPAEKDSSQILIHPPHKHSNSPSTPHSTKSSSKKNMLNSWRTSLRSKGRSSSGRFPPSAIPPMSSCVISEGSCDVVDSPRSPGYVTDEDLQNSRNDNSQNFEWNLGRRWSESVTTNPKLIFNLPNGTKGLSIPLPPTSLVKVIAEFQAINADEVTVHKGESVQILGFDREKNFYFVRKLIYPHDDGWIPVHIIQNPLDPSPSIKKPWSFRFKRPSFNKREKDAGPLLPETSKDPDSIRGSPIIGLFGTGSVEDVMDLFDESAPVFCRELQNVKCQSGETVILQCQLCMTPSNKFEPMVVFWKDAFGHVIRTGPRHQVIFSESDGSCILQIEECRLSDSGRYTCTASNDAGSSTTSAVISVTAVPPAKPSPPTVAAVETEFVELTWTPTSFTRASIVKFYTVQHCIAESELWTSCSVVAECKCRIHHLTPGQMYSFRIIAHGEGSTKSEPSPPSESVIIPILAPTGLDTSTSSEVSKSPNDSIQEKGKDSPSECAPKDKEFHKTYIELEDIDRGRFSIIRKCQRINCGEELAVKFVHRKRWKKQLIVKEFQILTAISHPNVVRGHAFCETSMYTAIVMEHVSGIPLFAYLCEQDIYMEYTVAAFMHQLFQGLEHIHGLEIAHLDIEPTNILIDKTVLPPVLKLVDFGDACYVAEGSPDCLPVTLPFFEFASPEVLLRQKCSVFSDMWSVGVLIYLILSGTFPFQGETFEKNSANIINCHYRFPFDSFVGVSSEAKELIKQLLVADPGERWSAAQCCQSSWVKQARKFVTPMNRSKLEPYIRGKTIENGLRRYRSP